MLAIRGRGRRVDSGSNRRYAKLWYRSSNSLEIRVSRDLIGSALSRSLGTMPTHERDEREAAPLASACWERRERYELRQTPNLADDAVQRSLLEIVGRPGEGEHREDLEHGRWDGEDVGEEGRAGLSAWVSRVGSRERSDSCGVGGWGMDEV
jgi:hypothetical protein